MCCESRTHSLEGVVEGTPSTTTLQFRKVKTSFVSQIQEVSNTLTLSAGVCDIHPSDKMPNAGFRLHYSTILF